MRLFCAALIALSVLVPIPVIAQDPTLLDPRLRDEDISGTVVSVDVIRAESGLYEYTYTYVSPASNKGAIRSFGVDISCDSTADRTGLPPQETTEGFKASASSDGRHSPINVFAAFGSAAIYGITERNDVLWTPGVKPGQSRTAIGLVSSMPPKARQYRLVPKMDNDDRWDYASFDEDDPTVPWIPDFTVFGMTRGPGCPGDPPSPPPAAFPGTLKPGETEAINALLTYSTPLSDRFHVPAGTMQLMLTIHYGKDIDPRSFKVEPQSDKVRKLFNPRKDSSETVLLPLDAGKNKFTLSVQREFVPPGQAKAAGTPPRGRLELEKDIDVFEVRVEAAVPAQPVKDTGKK